MWHRYAVPALWATWAPHIVGVDYPVERLRAGTSGRVRGPLRARADFTVDAVDEAARTWTWTVRAGPASLVLTHGVLPAQRGTETWLQVHGPVPLLVAYAPVAHLALGRLVGGG